MTGLVLSIPDKRVSAWVAETDPRATRAWLGTLPLADGAEAGREIHQALYTLNRQDLDFEQRFELMELYADPVARVAGSLHGYLANLALPLPPKKRQLAEFIRQLYVEMANGYKCCLHDLQKRRVSWTKKNLAPVATERAIYYLGSVLLRSYLVYLPCPAGVWRDVHGLYRYAEENNWLDEPVPAQGGDSGTAIRQSYLRILLLAAANPYQLPWNDQLLAHRLLGKWASAAILTSELAIANPAAHCIVDLASDSPPAPVPRETWAVPDPGLRVLNATGLVRVLHGFVGRLRKGEAIAPSELGVECLGPVCLDLFRRLGRAWGQMVRREHTRIKRQGNVLVCNSIGALHFFASGQKPYSPPAEEANPSEDGVARSNPPDVSVQLPEVEDAAQPTVAGAQPPVTPGEKRVPDRTTPYRIDRWQVRDISPKGILLVYAGDAAAHLRVGDVVGIQRTGQLGNWSAGVVRWLKSPGPETLEMGLELIAPRVVAVTVGALAKDPRQRPAYAQGLLLPAMPAVRRPATLLIPCGLRNGNEDLELIEEGGAARRLRVLKLLERSGAFEQLVFADVRRD